MSIRRTTLLAGALVALVSPSASAADMSFALPHVCYSMPTRVEVEAPVGVGITTSASASSSASCAPAVQGGVRGFMMTVTWTGTVSGGSALFDYSTNCGSSGPGPLTNNCGGSSTSFCQAPGTQSCSATAPAFRVHIFNDTLPLDNASATAASYTVTCRYLA